MAEAKIFPPPLESRYRLADGSAYPPHEPMTEDQLAEIQKILDDAMTDTPDAMERLLAEVRRLRGLLNTASSYLVDQDAHCQGCDRSIISADHLAECPVGKIEAEFGSEDDSHG